MTCIVPSFMRDDHLHFVDGADGGYTRAALALKAARAARDLGAAGCESGRGGPRPTAVYNDPP